MTSPSDNTYINYKDGAPIILFNNTTTNFRDLTQHNNKRNGPTENNDLILFGTLLGIFIVLCIFCAIGIYYNKGRICNRSTDVEGNATDECKPILEHKEHDNLELITRESQLDRVFFEHWQQENNLFIPTKACEEVENIIKNQNLVIVVGHSGSGKSSIIQHIALKYRSQGWVVKPAREITDIMNAFSSNNVLENQTLFVLNDPIGKESFDEIAYASWKINEEYLKACLKKIKILLSCRKCVQCDKRSKGLFKDNSKIVDIDVDKCKLSDDEKKQILNRYNTNNYIFSETDLTDILKTEAYFPLLCKLFFSDMENQKDGLRFFKEPIKEIKKEINVFKDSSKEKYCALIMIVLFNNALCISDLLGDKESEKMYEHALKLCGMKRNTALYTICDTLETLNGFYVTKIGDTYQFCHDLVMEVTTHVFGTYYPRDMIKYANIGFLRKRVKFGSCNDKKDQLIIHISDQHLDILGERLLKEIFGENLFDVVLNPCLKKKNVVDALINNIEKDKEKFEKLLLKKEFLFEKRKFDQESKELFFSKLDFVGLICNISPVCALIVFCHTDLSLYCLKALQQLLGNLKDSSVFFAVCCNGSIDLFDMFLEDDIKTFLKETWGPLFPIHIVSVFHNNEILRELIQLGVDVNQRTEDGWTALSLAVERITEERKENNCNISKKPRCYETLQLLLCNGADTNLCNKFGYSPLHTACQIGQDSTVELLLSHGADVNLCDRFGFSPLYTACLDANDSTVQLLLRHGADINLCNKYGFCPLYTACQNGHDSTVQMLLSHGANINLLDELGYSFLYKACENGQNNIVQLLLSHGADTNICNIHGYSPLFIAFENKHDNIVQLLLSHGADINLLDKLGYSLLYKACESGQDSTVQRLLSHGANINLSDRLGESPLHKACQHDHYSAVQLLLSQGADINLCDIFGKSPFHYACQNEQNNTVQILLSHGADINLCDKLGESPLHKACQHKHNSTVQLLLCNGADINVCNIFGHCPLYTACQNGHDSIVQILMSHGADVNLCDIYGEGPLYTACQNGHDSTVQILLGHGADVSLCDDYGESPLYSACQNGHDSIVQILLRHEACINSCNEHRYSPLYIACEIGHDSTVQLLLSHGADTNICNKFGHSPLWVACREKHEQIVQLLLNNKADVNLNKKNRLSPVFIAFYMRHFTIIKSLLDAGADTDIINGCGLHYVSSDWCDKVDITGQYLLRKNNIVDNLYDLDSFFSLFVFCQVEELTKILRHTSIDS